MQQIIPLEKLIRNHPRLCLISALICFFVIAPTVVYVANREWFRRKAIEVKYCYHWDGDTIQPYWRYKKVNSPQCYEKAYWMLAYYYIPDSLFPNTYRPDIQNSDFSQQECVYKVEVLRYSEDSLLATIRYKYPYSGGFYVETVEVVPSFTLHDTLPVGYKADNEGYMKNIRLKKRR